MFTRRKCYNKYHTIKRTTSLLLVSSSLRLFLWRISPIIDVLIHLQIFRCLLLSGPLATHPHHVRYQRRYLLQPQRASLQALWKSLLGSLGCSGSAAELSLAGNLPSMSLSCGWGVLECDRALRMFVKWVHGGRCGSICPETLISMFLEGIRLSHIIFLILHRFRGDCCGYPFIASTLCGPSICCSSRPLHRPTVE
jgi:hypothetical protein